MKKTLILILISIVMISLFPITTVSGEDINTNTHDIVISADDTSISVVESLTIQGTSNETITFWIQKESADINILINSNNVEPTPLGNNEYSCNISNFDIATDTSVQLTYVLDKDTKKFEKTLIHNTTSISIKFDDNEIYAKSELTSGSYFSLSLQKPTPCEPTTAETPLSWYIIILILLLVILLAVTTTYSLRKQKSTQIRDMTGGSEELLITKKTLLMSLLKDIEKQHRGKQISDDTYHKLKEQYKQQAVDAMKKLEDMKSKVK